MAASHPSKDVQISSADRQHLAAPLEVDLRGLVVAPADVVDGAEVDDDGAVHLRKVRGIELRRQLLERNPHRGLAVAPGYDGVLRVGARVVYVVDGDQTENLAALRVDPT